MRRVQEHLHRTNPRTIITMSSALAGVGFWKTRMDEYLRCLPAMLSMGHKVSEHQQTLASMGDELEAVPKLAQILKDLPELSATLRSGSTDELQNAAQQGLMKLWPVFLAKASKDAKQCELSEMMALVTMASDIYGLNAKIQEMVQECGSLLQRQGQAKLADEMSASVASVLETKKATPAERQPVMEQFLTHVRPITLQEASVKAHPSLETKVADLVEMLWGLAAEESVKSKEGRHRLELYQQCANLAVSKVPDEKLKLNVKCLEALAGVSTAVAWVAEEIEECDRRGSVDDACLMRVCGLKQALQRLDVAKAGTRDLNSEYLEHVLVSSSDGAAVHDELKGILIEDGLRELKLSFDDMVPMALGGQGGSWLKGFKGTTFSELLQHAQTTLLTMRPAAFILVQTRLCKVLPVRDYRQLGAPAQDTTRVWLSELQCCYWRFCCSGLRNSVNEKPQNH